VFKILWNVIDSVFFLSQKTDSFVHTLSFIKNSSFDQEDGIRHLATWFWNLVTEDEIFLQSCAKRYGINDSRKDNRSCYKSRNLQIKHEEFKLLEPQLHKLLFETDVFGKYCELKKAILTIVAEYGSVAKNLALLQNQWKTSQFGNLIIFIREKMTHKSKNYSIKQQKNYFCNGTLNIPSRCLHPEDRKIMTALGVSESSVSNIYRINK